ncbi:hypothetical protein ACLOJK_035538 [Asimina triloba]
MIETHKQSGSPFISTGNRKGILNDGISAGLETAKAYDLTKPSPVPTFHADGKAIRGLNRQRTLLKRRENSKGRLEGDDSHTSTLEKLQNVALNPKTRPREKASQRGKSGERVGFSLSLQGFVSSRSTSPENAAGDKTGRRQAAEAGDKETEQQTPDRAAVDGQRKKWKRQGHLMQIEEAAAPADLRDPSEI